MFIYKYMTIYDSRYPPRFFPFPYSLKPRRMKLQKIFYTSKEKGHLFQDTLLNIEVKLIKRFALIRHLDQL